MLGLNYPPEPTGISPYTGAMARGLAKRGYETVVFTFMVLFAINVIVTAVGIQYTVQ